MKGYIVSMVVLVFFVIICVVAIDRGEPKSKESLENGYKQTNNGFIEGPRIYYLEDSVHYDSLMQDNEKVLVQFYAEWCPYCKEFTRELPYVLANKQDLNILMVNIEEHRKLANSYYIVATPTLVYYEKGEKKNGFPGFLEKEKVLEWMETGRLPLH